MPSLRPLLGPWHQTQVSHFLPSSGLFLSRPWWLWLCTLAKKWCEFDIWQLGVHFYWETGQFSTLVTQSKYTGDLPPTLELYHHAMCCTLCLLPVHNGLTIPTFPRSALNSSWYLGLILQLSAQALLCLSSCLLLSAQCQVCPHTRLSMASLSRLIQPNDIWQMERHGEIKYRHLVSHFLTWPCELWRINIDIEYTNINCYPRG